jgi:acyl-coenzyme A thioesterase PaaI-like protein
MAGALAGLIDTAGDFGCAGARRGGADDQFRVDYLRPNDPAPDRRRNGHRAGRTVAVVDIDVEDGEGRLVAVGRGCYATQPG